jgi:predicted RNA-binding protein YlxR (DUF448 family)
LSESRAHEPTRSCAGCNGRDAQSRMGRFTLVEGRLAWDVARRRGGRGAYLHGDAKCVDAFTSRKPFLRSLRASVPAAERARLIAERPL